MSEDDKALIYNLRSLARMEHTDLSIGDEAADAIERLTRELSEATTRAERAEAALERDRTAVITACNKVCEEMAGRAWLLEGRGPYEWDDDRYRQEFSTALRAIEAPIEALRKIGRDWSNCPSDPQSISDAREDWKARAERAEAALREIAALDCVSVSDFQNNEWEHQRIARAALSDAPAPAQSPAAIRDAALVEAAEVAAKKAYGFDYIMHDRACKEIAAAILALREKEPRNDP